MQVNRLVGKNVFLWGARMTGLGALRKLNAEGIHVQNFIDSDPALWGLVLNNLNVLSPNDAKPIYERGGIDVIVITAILKAEDIKRSIEKIFGKSAKLEIYLYGSEEAPSYTVDIIGTCNLKCGSCPHSLSDHGVPKGSMSVETFKKVLGKALHETPSLSHISLYSWGDPLLHPHLPQIIDLCHHYNIAVALSSNLSINLDRNLADIVESNPDYFKVSVSGFTQKVYGKTHQGGDINLVKSNLYKLRYLMDRKRKSFLVDINYHLYRNNVGDELNQFKSLANDLDFILSETHSLVMPLERVFAHLEGSPDYNTQILNEELLLVTIDEGIEASGGKELGKRNCPFLLNQVNINADLSVPLCCLTFNRNLETTAVQNYLSVKAEDIVSEKLKKKLCIRCQAEGLPEYNMGFNKEKWVNIARGKGCDL
jgi:uncharacterized Fe-S cluster-containing radical SAM superfamily protein